MKVMACVKQCYDPESRIIVADGAIQEAGLRLTINPYDAVALTQASKLRKAGVADELVAVSVGSDVQDSTMRHALAIGADRAIVARVEGELDQGAVVRVLADIARNERPDLIMCGHLSSDRSSSQVPARLAEELGIPAITMASTMQVEGGYVTGVHEVEDGSVTSRAPLPALVSAQVYMTQTHYVAMKSLMMARKKTIDVVEYPASAPSLRVVRYEAPAEREPGERVVAEPREAAEKLLAYIERRAGVTPVVGERSGS